MSGALDADPSSQTHSPSAAAALTLVATPIGNLGDLSPRALASLAAADTILCEDTRVTGRLLSLNGISAPMLPLHDHNERAVIPRAIALMRAGSRLVLVSDAGTPVVSDPGFRLVRAAIEAGLGVSAVPGANAAIMALSLSGLPPAPFLFLGFLPPRAAARRAALAGVAAAERAGLGATLVAYEAPHRLAEFLADCRDMLNFDRPAAVARELTKRFEEVRRGTLGALAEHYAAHAPRGEVTVVIGPPDPEPAPDDAELDRRLRAAMATTSVKDAAAAVAAATGLPRRTVYARALALGAGMPE